MVGPVSQPCPWSLLIPVSAEEDVESCRRKAARGIRNDRKRKGVRNVNASVKSLKRAS